MKKLGSGCFEYRIVDIGEALSSLEVHNADEIYVVSIVKLGLSKEVDKNGISKAPIEGSEEVYDDEDRLVEHQPPDVLFIGSIPFDKDKLDYHCLQILKASEGDDECVYCFAYLILHSSLNVVCVEKGVSLERISEALNECEKKAVMNTVPLVF